MNYSPNSNLQSIYSSKETFDKTLSKGDNQRLNLHQSSFFPTVASQNDMDIEDSSTPSSETQFTESNQSNRQISDNIIGEVPINIMDNTYILNKGRSFSHQDEELINSIYSDNSDDCSQSKGFFIG